MLLPCHWVTALECMSAYVLQKWTSLSFKTGHHQFERSTNFFQVQSMIETSLNAAT